VEKGHWKRGGAPPPDPLLEQVMIGLFSDIEISAEYERYLWNSLPADSSDFNRPSLRINYARQ